MTMPTATTFVGKERAPVEGIYYDGQYREGQLLDIKAWIDTTFPGIQTDMWMTTIDGVDVPYFLNVYDAANNLGFTVQSGWYIFKDDANRIRTLEGTIFEILFTPQV